MIYENNSPIECKKALGNNNFFMILYPKGRSSEG